MDMDQKPALYLKDDELKMVKTTRDQIRDYARNMLIDYHECFNENYFKMARPYDINPLLTINQLKMRERGFYLDEFLFFNDHDDDKKLNCFDMYDNEIPYNNSFSNIPDPPAAKRAQIRYDNERALWIKENQELIQTILNDVREFEYVNQRGVTCDDFTLI